MNKQDLLNLIMSYESQIGMWQIILNECVYSDFVLGYYYNEEEQKYNVYINHERGWHSIRLCTTDEIEALTKLLKMVKYEAKLNSL